MAQKLVQKRRTACYKQARYESYQREDESTEGVLRDALKASKHARKVLREAELFVESLR